MNKNTARTIAKHGLAICQRAYALNRDGEGCSTIGIYLGVHWKTASSLVDAGRELASSEMARSHSALPYAVGDCAVYTDCIGNSQSVTISKVLPHAVEITWRTGPLFSECLWLTKEQWGRLVLLPPNCKFFVI